MKKKFFYALLPVLMTGCASSDFESNSSGNDETNGEVTRYLNLRVVSATQSRADAVYENGSDTENAVGRVRFYFFDADGNPAPVWENKGTGNSTFNSYQDWYPGTSDGSSASGNTVEKAYNVTLGLMLPSNLANNQPALVLAVLNPPAQVLNLTASNSIDTGNGVLTVNGPSLETLKATVGNYLTGMSSSGTFVMTNSAYVDDGAIIDATIIDPSNYGATEEDAKQTSITIYVERVLARVDFKMALNATDNPVITVGDNTYYKVGSYKVFNGSDNATDENIYVELLGWNITGTTSASRLVKMISAGWDTGDLFGGDTNGPWTTFDYHRSFWAVNPMSSQFEYLFGDFQGTASSTNFPANAQKIPTGDNAAIVYLQENANTYNVTEGAIAPKAPEYPTKVIIAARLVDSQGNPFPMAEWNYYKYTLPQMKTKMAQALGALYKRTSNQGGGYTYTPIAPADFTFATAVDLNMNDPDEASYYVYPVLTDTAETYTWTMGNAANASVMDTDAVNTYLRDTVNHVMVWNEGLTYYFFDIRHLGEEESPAYFGIVRNHIYRTTLTSIAGLGTPVYDPTETIYPEKTEDGDNIVTADIQILQWRVVAQDYNITWP